MKPGKRWAGLRSLLAVALLFAALNCGCLWGVVRDADTRTPVAGARVTVKGDSGGTITTTTDANGFFVVNPAPAAGRTRFQVEATGYEAVSTWRDVRYDDNPNATLDNVSTFWELQTFSLFTFPGGYYNEAGHYRLVFPDGWWPSETQPGSASVIAYSEGGPTCRITTAPIPAGQTLRSVVEAMIDALRNAPEISHLESGEIVDTEVNGFRAVKTTYSYDYMNPGFDNPLGYEDLVYYIGKDRNGYLIECYAFVEEFPSARPIFEEIVQSFRAD